MRSPIQAEANLKHKHKEKLNPALVMAGIGLVHSLGMDGVPVYAGSDTRGNPSLYSRYAMKKCYFSDYRSEQFIGELLSLGQTLEKKAVVFSDNDDALLTISNNRDRLSDYFLFLFPEPDLVRQVLDKKQFFELAITEDLPVPVTVGVSNEKELTWAVRQLQFPLIIKPVNRSDWYHKDFTRLVGRYKKAYRFDDESELYRFYSRLSQINTHLVVQEYVEGEDEMHFEVNMYVDKERNVKGYYIGQKPRIYPVGAGIGSYIKTIRDNGVVEKVRWMVDTLDLQGLLDFQFKRDASTGEAKLLEIHFRSTIWGQLGSIAGMNLHKMYYNDLVGQEEPVPKIYRSGVRYFVLTRDIPAFLQYRREGKLTFREWIDTYRGDFVIEECRLGDLPFLFVWIFFTLRSWIKKYVRSRE
jgi:D-aspartate ligase